MTKPTPKETGQGVPGGLAQLALARPPAFPVATTLQDHPIFPALDAAMKDMALQQAGLAELGRAASAPLGAALAAQVASRAGLAELGRAASAPLGAALAAAAGLNRYHVQFGQQIGQILSAQYSIAGFVAETDLMPASALFDTVSRYSQVQLQLGELAGVKHAQLLHGLTKASGRRYDSYLAGLPGRPIARRAAVARFAGDAQSGMVVAESLTSLGLDNDDRDHLADEFTTRVLEPWEIGSAQLHEDLFTALARLEPGLDGFLKAAWEDITLDGSQAASKVGHCLVECIDRTLRALAPMDDVRAWVGDVGPKRGWLGEDGRPTRRARLMFAMRNRPQRDTLLVDCQVEALVNVVQVAMRNLQDVKHSETRAIVVVRGLLVTTEAALSQLLLHD